jgi:hypothetical protein
MEIGEKVMPAEAMRERRKQIPLSANPSCRQGKPAHKEFAQEKAGSPAFGGQAAFGMTGGGGAD